jgi:hypothetical protein
VERKRGYFEGVLRLPKGGQPAVSVRTGRVGWLLEEVVRDPEKGAYWFRLRGGDTDGTPRKPGWPR